jgi:predicted membrane-bound spermidine synthase
LRLRAALPISALAGFVGLSYEVLWFRALTYVTDGAAWTFGALLGTYLLGVGLSSLGTRALAVRHPAPAPGHVLWIAGFAGVANAAAYLVIPALAAAAARGTWWLALALLGLSAGLLGALLPALAHLAIPPDGRAGAHLSYLYLADIVGSALGSVLTGYVLLDRLDTRGVSLLLAGVGFALTAALAAAAGRGARPLLAAVAGGALAFGAAWGIAPRAFDRLWERLQWRAGDAGERFARIVENRHGVIAVTRDGVLYGGGAYDGAFSTSLADDRNGIYRAYLVPAMHPAPRRVLLIGLGSGSWAKVLAHLPGVERLTVVEINPGYLDVIREQPEVADLLSDPRVEIAIDDGRRWLVRHPEQRFDVIVANVTLHWRVSSTNLLSREFVELARARLAPGGLYYFNTTFFRPARETALDVFGHGVQIGTFFAAADAPIAWDGARLSGALRAMRLDGAPVLPADDGPLLGRLSEPPRAHARTPGARLVTDDNMLPEWRGAPFDVTPPRRGGRPITPGTR